ncbi:transposase, Mutator family protein [Erwinia tracheiphila PSU-1]|nr:transposase, Mutator family protein [Erwinia tracheiphila PSU-1]
MLSGFTPRPLKKLFTANPCWTSFLDAGGLRDIEVGAVTRDLKAICQARTEEAGQRAREAFAGARDSRYPQISRSWKANRASLSTFFAYPADIRKTLDTTSAIESLNSVIRDAIKKRKVFPTDDAVKKEVWLAIQAASQKWTMPRRDWRMAMSRFIIGFGDRPDGHY